MLDKHKVEHDRLTRRIAEAAEERGLAALRVCNAAEVLAAARKVHDTARQSCQDATQALIDWFENTAT